MKRALVHALGFALLAAALAGCHYASGPARHAREDSSRTPAGVVANPRDELLVIERSGQDLPGTRPQPDQEPRGGELRAKLADQEVLLPLKHTQVRAQVMLYLGSVTVKQQYHNPYDGKIEAVYVFPLPTDAAVRDFVMVIGDRRIRGVIREREEAQKIYEEAKAAGHVASLMTQDRPNIFTQSVANIEPGKAIDIDITYFHTLAYAEGRYEFHFPMVVGPRFNPEGFRDGVGAVPRGAHGASGQKTEVQHLRPTEISTHDIDVEVAIDAGLFIDGIESPTHVIRVERRSESKAVVRLSPNDRIPNKDFVLRYRVAGDHVKGALALKRDGDGGHFSLVLQPPADLASLPEAKREMIFVLDCSGSMSGLPIQIAKRTVMRALQRLNERDSFQVIDFSVTARAFGHAPVPATPDNIRRALSYVDGLESSGGTYMIEGVKAALDFPHDPSRFRIVSFITDGYIGNDREIIGEVRRRLGDSRVFSFGIGSSVNRYLIEGMARAGRGVAAVVTLNEAGEKAVEELYRRVEHPAMTDLRVDWGGLQVSDVNPSPIPDLFVGRPVVLTGRFRGAGKATVRVTGRVGGEERALRLDVDLDHPTLEHPALPAVWARAKMTDLYDRMAWSDEREERDACVRAIRELALEYGLLSDFTAFVAVDSLTVTEGDTGTTVPVPVPVPDGVKYKTTVPEKP